jgi:signal transduction histidine kinase
METGEWRTQLEDINLTVFLQNMVKTLNTDVELLHHALIHEINLPKKILVPLDERLALRAFENLIHNAVRYTPNGAVIRLHAVRLENSAGSAGVELTISDNGPGIDKDDLPYIFEMFYRGSSSRHEQGMGLGLAVVKWVADYHCWSISVSSQKGKGTCFTIGIPLGNGE